jgi:hypothetical protein
MMREGLLKENIDGEALAWAHRRLLARPERRRILMMISDGAPVDDSTLSVNPGNYLERHLRWVIEEVEQRSPVELIAIGSVTMSPVTIVAPSHRRRRRAGRCDDREARRAVRRKGTDPAPHADPQVARVSATARGILSAAIVVFVSILVSSASPQPAPRAPEGPIHITINAQEIEAFEPGNPSRIRFGPLEFRGGLELSSSYREFGGVSALRLFPDGEHFISLTDKGRWLRGRIAYQRGRPVAIEDVEMAPILGPDGRPLSARGWYDTESIAIDGGTLYVGIERVNRIVRFDYGRQGLLARGQPFAPPWHCEPSQQQRTGVPGVRSDADARRGHADRDLGTRSRQRGKYQGILDWWAQAGRVQRRASR